MSLGVLDIDYELLFSGVALLIIIMIESSPCINNVIDRWFLYTREGEFWDDDGMYMEDPEAGEQFRLSM